MADFMRRAVEDPEFIGSWSALDPLLCSITFSLKGRRGSKRSRQVGPNRLPSGKARSPPVRFASQLDSVLTHVQLGSALITACHARVHSCGAIFPFHVSE